MSDPRERFGSRALLGQLASLPRPARRYWVAYSGGADSTALLHAIAPLRGALRVSVAAWHVNHGLHPDSDAWQAHCAGVCGDLGLPFVAERVSWDEAPRANLEARAREARYAMAEQRLERGDVLLTAQHRDDQAETLLLALLRGSGVDGLGAMPPARRLGPGWLARPLLAFGRDELVSWLRERRLPWLQDPANEDPRHDRTHLRQVVLPALAERWPDAPLAVARSAALLRETSDTLSNWAAARLEGRGEGPVLDLHAAAPANEGETRLLLRAWLRSQGAHGLPGARLREFVAQASAAGRDTRCECAWARWRLNAWDDRFWLSRADAWSALPPVAWDTSAPLRLPGAGGLLRVNDGVLSPPLELVVRSRRPGDRVRAAGTAHHRRLKDLLREWRIPPWMRTSVPIIEQSGETVAVADRVLHARLADRLQEAGATLRWSPGDPALEQAWNGPGTPAG